MDLPAEVLMIIFSFLHPNNTEIILHVNYFITYLGKTSCLLRNLTNVRNCLKKMNGYMNIIIINFFLFLINCLFVWKILILMRIIDVRQRISYWIRCFIQFFLFMCGIIYLCVIGLNINLICVSSERKYILKRKNYQSAWMKNCLNKRMIIFLFSFDMELCQPKSKSICMKLLRISLELIWILENYAMKV